MARVEIPPRCHGKIFRSGTASGQSLVYTRTAFEIDHKMEKVKAVSFLPALNHLCRKLVILFKQNRKILVLKRVCIALLRDYRLDRYLLEAKICKV